MIDRIKKIKNIERMPLLVFIVLLILLMQSVPVAVAEERIVDIRSDFPGQMIEAGNTATFPITITNLAPTTVTHRIRYWAFGEAANWDIRFEAAGRNIHKISIPPGESRPVNVIVETPGDAPIGEHRIDVTFGDGSVTLFVSIIETEVRIIDIRSDFPDQRIAPPATATFSITITNPKTTTADHRIQHTAFGEAANWDIRFEAAGRNIHRISIPPGESRPVNVIVEPPGDAPIGEHRIDVSFGDGSVTLSVSIIETHEGKPGTLRLTTVNRDGDKVRGAIVSAYMNGEQISQIRTTAAGLLSMDLEEAIYDIKIERAGYEIRWERDVRIRVRRDTDIGIIVLERKSFAAEVRVDVPSKTITAGTRPVFAITIENIGEFEDTFKLRVAGLPHGWHARYMVRGTEVEVTEVFIRSGESKDLDLEIIPPHGIGIGEYNFASVIESSALVYDEALSLSIRGTIDMLVGFDRLRVEITRGGTASFEVTVRNHGRGISLTDVRPDVSAPEGWHVEITPRTVTRIVPGERKVFNVVVIPPADIVAGEYRLRMTVGSDQIEEEVEFRVIVVEGPFLALLGVAILIMVAIGLWVIFRKFGRR
ncbi:MAG: NEW3 domain-containing protein [Dehalococcoidia bacterium]